MNNAKLMMFGGVLAVVVIGGLAVAPANAGTFVSVNVGSYGGSYVPSPCYVPPPCGSYYSSYPTYSPYFSSSYRHVSYRSGGYAHHGLAYYGGSYRTSGPRYYSSHYSRRAYFSGPGYSHRGQRVYVNRFERRGRKHGKLRAVKRFLRGGRRPIVIINYDD